MGGRSLNDHSFWAGAKPAGSVFPAGAKVKMESSDGHGGTLNNYEDTTEKVKAQQSAGVAKMKAHPTKALYRN